MIDTRSCEYCSKVECECKEEISRKHLRHKWLDKRDQKARSDAKAQRSAVRAASAHSRR